MSYNGQYRDEKYRKCSVWAIRNIEKLAEKRHEYYEKLPDACIKLALKAKHWPITKEYIELQRLMIKISREIKKQNKNGNTKNEN